MLAERAEPVQKREHEYLIRQARGSAAVLSASGGSAAGRVGSLLGDPGGL
jgi:hypothetical protein